MQTIAKFRSSSSFLMASIFSFSLLTVICLVVYFIVIASDETLLRESEDAIDADIRMFQESASLNDIDYVKRILQHRLEDPENTYFYLLKSPRGKVIMGNIPEWPKDNVEVPKEGIIQFEIGHEQLNMPVKSGRANSDHYDVMAKIHSFEKGHTLLVGRNVDDLEIAQWVAITFGWLAIAIATLLGAGFFVIGNFVVKKINTISETANDIMQTGNISKRIQSSSKWDDLSKLVEILNHMLDEIESLVMNTKRVTDNIAHDLRTPLTRLRNDLEGVKNKQQREELLKEADNLLAMFNGLLRIAEIETEKKKSEFTSISLNQIAEDAVGFYQPLADEKNIIIENDISPLSYVGDRNLIFQAFANIIDNAIKFSPEGSEIKISLSAAENDIIFSVHDSGPGIQKKEQTQVFRRFYRSDHSRNKPGHGLGLSIVRATVKLHNGTISLINTESGLNFEINFPKLT